MTERRETGCLVQNSDDETLDGFPNSDLKDVSKSEMSSESLSGNKLVEEAEECVICFKKFSEKIGSPDSCDHFFCLNCISDWSKGKNTCPLDRKTFSRIELFEMRGGQIQRTGEDCLDITPKYDEGIGDHINFDESLWLYNDREHPPFGLELALPPRARNMEL